MQKLILVFCFLCTVTIISAQNDFRPGYIIRLNGEKVDGLINYGSESNLCKKCVFIESTGKNSTTYYPNQIKGFRFKDSRYFISKLINDKWHFLEYLIQGKLDIYHLNINNSEHYYLEKSDDELVEIPADDEVISTDSTGTRHISKSKKHIGLLTYYLSDAPQIKNDIANLTILTDKSLISLAQKYHSAVCNDEKCIIFEKPTPPIKVNLEIFGGFNLNPYNSELTYFDEEKYEMTKNFVAGIYGHFWFPSIGDKIFIKTGINYMYLEHNKVHYYDPTHQTNLIIPLFVEYIYHKGIIRPKIAAGGYYATQLGHSNQLFSFDMDLGLNFKITKSVFLSTDWSVKRKFLTAGLFYKF